MTFWVARWLRAFATTLALEIIVAVPLLRGVEPRRWRRVTAVTVANLATHPLVWFAFPGLALGRSARIALSEAWAVLAELAIYLLVWPALRWRRALPVSLAANAVSFAAGLVIGRVIL